MKKMIVLSLIMLHFIMLTGIVNAQICTSDPGISTTGNDVTILPDTTTVLVKTPGQAFSQTFTMYVPLNFEFEVNGFPIQGNFDSIMINEVSGVPAGFVLSCGTPNCIIKAGEAGCFTLTGNMPLKNDTCFYISVIASPYGKITGPDIILSVFSSTKLEDNMGSSAIARYKIEVGDCNACTTELTFNSSSSNDSICENDCINFYPNNPCNEYDSWEWNFDGGSPASSASKYPTVCYSNEGVYMAKLMVSNSSNPNVKDTISKNISVKSNTLAVSFSGLNTNYCRNSASSTLTGVPLGGTFSGEAIVGNAFAPMLATSASSTYLNESIQYVTYSYSDAFGCSNSSTKSTNVIIQASPTICMVTVDDASEFNNVYWNKTTYTYIDSFIVYRETSSNLYKRVGAVQNKELSMFVDTTRYTYFPFSGNPNAGTYRYKLQTLDSCGNYSSLSKYHNTIYIDQNGGNFNWNAYQIEDRSSPLPEIDSYSLYRDDNGTDAWSLVNAVSGSQLTINDPDYKSHLNARYRIEADWTTGCVATKSASSPKSNSKVNDTTSIGIENNESKASAISIFPNPSSGRFTVLVAEPGKYIELTVLNVLGETVFTTESNSNKVNLDLASQVEGVYFLRIIIGAEVITKKITLTN